MCIEPETLASLMMYFDTYLSVGNLLIMRSIESGSAIAEWSAFKGCFLIDLGMTA